MINLIDQTEPIITFINSYLYMTQIAARDKAIGPSRILTADTNHNIIYSMKSLHIYIIKSFTGLFLLVQWLGCGSAELSVPADAQKTQRKQPLYNLEQLAHFRDQASIQIKSARQKICSSYFERDTSAISHSYAIHIINMRQESRSRLTAINDPLQMYSDVLCAVELSENRPLFLPDLLKGGRSIRYPQDAGNLDGIIEALRAGFVLGHPMVGLMFATSQHQIMGAFRDDGQFYIIDSLGGGAINVDELATGLNRAQIVDKNGYPIIFAGKSIGTRLQKSGNDCIRLAALYLRQILKENDLDAYQKVNQRLCGRFFAKI